MTTPRRLTLSFSCPDRVGIVAAVSNVIAGASGWILESSNHAHEGTNRFFMRVEMLAASLTCGVARFQDDFAAIAKEFSMDWKISDSSQKKRVVLLVSKQEHCLYDLLGRWQSKELDIEIPCVISNHETFRGLVEWHGIPFHCVPVTPDNKTEAFREIARLYDDVQGEVMVLARYMQVLTPEICAQYHGQIINIHHSFLPSFIGAKPYHQAYDKGVKLIGATCHYVTEELDQGQIIEQDVIRVDHSDLVGDLVRYGKDIEKAVLARGLRAHLEDRVLVHGNKTVVFK